MILAWVILALSVFFIWRESRSVEPDGYCDMPLCKNPSYITAEPRGEVCSAHGY